MPAKSKIVNHFNGDIYYTTPYKLHCMDEDTLQMNNFVENFFNPHYEIMYSALH